MNECGWDGLGGDMRPGKVVELTAAARVHHALLSILHIQ